MEQAMIASEMTDGQIDNLVSKLRDALRKHRSHISSDIAQQVLGLPNIGMDMYAPIRAHAEAISKLVVRKIAVNRTRSPQEALDATGRVQYVDQDTVATMPACEGDFEATFVNLGRFVATSKLIEELAKEGWELIVDPQGLADLNATDSTFANMHPNATQWQDADGNYCCATFNRWFDERCVYVGRRDVGWDDDWWFPCRRKALGA